MVRVYSDGTGPGALGGGEGAGECMMDGAVGKEVKSVASVVGGNVTGEGKEGVDAGELAGTADEEDSKSATGRRYAEGEINGCVALGHEYLHERAKLRWEGRARWRDEGEVKGRAWRRISGGEPGEEAEWKAREPSEQRVANREAPSGCQRTRRMGEDEETGSPEGRWQVPAEESASTLLRGEEGSGRREVGEMEDSTWEDPSERHQEEGARVRSRQRGKRASASVV